MPLHSLDLVFSPAHDAAIRERWDALERAGLPNLARHRGSSNAPHVTVLSAPRFEESVLQRARELFGTLLPCTLPVTGLVVLGRGPWVLAEALAVPAAVLTAVEDLRALQTDGPEESRPWVPHVTLAKRMDGPTVAQALEVLGATAAPEILEVTALRRWNPELRETTVEAP